MQVFGGLCEVRGARSRARKKGRRSGGAERNEGVQGHSEGTGLLSQPADEELIRRGGGFVATEGEGKKKKLSVSGPPLREHLVWSPLFHPAIAPLTDSPWALFPAAPFLFTRGFVHSRQVIALVRSLFDLFTAPPRIIIVALDFQQLRGWFLFLESFSWS